MNRYVMEEFYNDPALRRRLFAGARRERNRTVRAALAWLRDRIRDRLTPHLHARPSRWIERLG
jgi:hypothetical protein